MNEKRDRREGRSDDAATVDELEAQPISSSSMISGPHADAALNELEGPPQRSDEKIRPSQLALAPPLAPPKRATTAEYEETGDPENKRGDSDSTLSDPMTEVAPGAYREGAGYYDRDDEETAVASPALENQDVPTLTAVRVTEPEIAEIVQEEPGWWSVRRHRCIVFGVALLIVAVGVIVALVVLFLPQPTPSSPTPIPTPGGRQWKQLGGEIPGASPGDHAGYSVALSSNGTIVAVGAPFADKDGAINSGEVAVYGLDENEVWTRLGQTLTASGVGDWFGRSVALSSDGFTLAVGASENDLGGVDSGQTRVFRFDGSAWTQLGDDILGDAPYDRSGLSVSLSDDGDILAIGAIFASGPGGMADAGNVRVFELADGDTWSPIGSTIVGEGEGDQSGWSVSLSSDGNTVAIGAYNNDDSAVGAGHVRVFRFDGQDWAKVGASITGERAEDEFGISVSLSSNGNVVAIGARRNDGNGSNAGHVQVYQLASDVWTQIDKDIDGQEEGEETGRAVALSSDGTILAVGAPLNDDAALDAGQVRVYGLDGGAWTLIGSGINGEEERDNAGYSVALSSSGMVVAMGARWNNANGESSGHVRVYRLDGRR